jgi:small subunit ribosomal protein S3
VKGKYQEFLRGDIMIREFLNKKLRGYYVSDVEIERNEKALRIIIETSRPGMIIGRSGEGAVKLKNELMDMMKKKKVLTNGEVKLDIKEVRYPESNSAIVAQMVAEGLEKRMPFRRVLKQTIEKVMANKEVQGIKIEISGRLGGAEMSRTEKMKKGRVPLQTLRADVDFTKYEAYLPYGKIGVKVWIYKGEIFKNKNQG